ncbi:945_t:CDS:1 [Funneliformis geosporum]|nr:945_t:CDS:1 [Funneliformis geosporum]
MNNKNLEQLLNISKFLSTIPPSNIHSVQAYVLTINTSDIFSTTFDTSHETLSPLVNIDNTAKKIHHLQYPYLTSALVFSNGDYLLNFIFLIFNANQMLTLQFRLAMIVELMKFSDFYLDQKFFEEDYSFSDITLNLAKNSDMPITYNKKRECLNYIDFAQLLEYIVWH